MKSISVFNNKGGVGKTTLTFHLAHALSALNKKVLMIDADPQCNLTIYSLSQDRIHNIWAEEDPFIDNGFEDTKNNLQQARFQSIVESPRSLHFLLKPTEEGTGELSSLPPPVRLTPSLDILPGRLTLHLYEEKIAERWSGIYRGDPLAIRTVTKIRELSLAYSARHDYDIVIIDTSPSLGLLNKILISTVDGFFIPAFPDLFSLYGIKNIGKSLRAWRSEFEVIYKLISEEKRRAFPESFVSFLGYTIYNAKKYAGTENKWDLAKAHLNYAEQIPETIKTHIDKNIRSHLDDQTMRNPIGGTATMHTHNTFPAMAQHYHLPMWEVPQAELEHEHQNTIRGASAKYKETRDGYSSFSKDLLKRIDLLTGE